MADGRGLPLLSGPPPPPPTEPTLDACRKCNKEFNMFLNRSRKCYHCGYSYCHNCSDYQALMPRTGQETGYDVMSVCAYCIEFLTITAGGRGHLRALPLSKLKKYVNAYNIKIDRAVEKDDLIDAILCARTANGCLSRESENYYRKYSVPERPSGSRPRGLFSRAAHGSNNAAPPPPPPPRPSDQQPIYNFPRPDLEPDEPHHQRPRYAPPPGPPPQSHYQAAPPPPPSRPQPPRYSQHPPPPPRPQTHPNNQPRQSYPPHPIPQPPTPPRASRPQGPGPYQRPAASHSYHNIANMGPNSNRTPPRPRAASAAPPTTAPTPTLDNLLEMTPDAMASLSVGALKAILFTNHVNAGLILEKRELVEKVRNLVEDERRERQRQRAIEEQEEADRIERQRVLLEAHRKAEEERERGDGEGQERDRARLGPKGRAAAAELERTGLCVICQDEEANIAIVDCGHLAMCRGCSDMVMGSSRECPLCRTRIVTEARLLRIFKT